MKCNLNLKRVLGAMVGFGALVGLTHAADPELSCSRLTLTSDANGPTSTGETSAPNQVQPKARGYFGLYEADINSDGLSKYRYRYDIPNILNNLSWFAKYPNKVCDSKGVCKPSFNTTHVAVVVYRNAPAAGGSGSQSLAAFSSLSSSRIVERKTYSYQATNPLAVLGGAIVETPTLQLGGSWSLIVQQIQRSQTQVGIDPFTGAPIYLTSDVVMNASSCTLEPPLPVLY